MLFFLLILVKFFKMRRIVFFCVVFFSIQLHAQLFVSNNSYVFNRDSFVYVTGNVELNGTNSNFYLRNQGQLLQGATGSSSNRGTGRLSVYQEGTVNNFAYNYWCSPVGNASASIGNEPFGITMLHVPTTNVASTPAIMSGSFNGVSGSGSLSIATYWIWRFLSSTNYAQWVHSQANTDIQAGQGFTMKGTSGSDATNVGEVAVNNPGSAQRYDFRGKPNDGNITINVGLNSFTLTGNPYSSAIDLNLFLTDPLNAAIDGTALFWEHDKTVNSHNIAQYRGGYGTYNGSTSVYTPATFYTYDLAGIQGSAFSSPNNIYQRRFSPIGQGFMVRGAANGAVQMRNSYRLFRREGVATNSQFERNSNEVQTADYGFYEDIPNVAGIDYTQVSKAPTPHFIVNTSLNNLAVRQIAIAFLPNAIDGVDLADSKFPIAEADITADVYLILNNDLYVHSTTSFDENKRFPIGFKNATSGLFTFTIRVHEFINFDVDNVFLHDLETGLYHDIKDSFYEVTLPSGIYNNRFEITFKNQSLSNNDLINENIAVFQNNQLQEAIVSNPDMTEIKEITLYSIDGKKISSKNNLSISNEYRISTAGLAESVYIIDVVTTTKKVAKKIIVSKSMR